jgi:resuscitation-promoting factor RpfB
VRPGSAAPARTDAARDRWDPPPAGATGRPGPWQPAEPVAAAAGGGEPRRGVRHPVRLALYALVLFGLLAGSAAWLVVDKSVRLTVDGEGRMVSTYASTVAGVLDDAGVTVSPRDVLAPAAESRISDGAEIVLRRGRLLRLTIDGKSREVWVTATTVQEALDQVGYRQSGLFVSATRSERLPLEGYELTVRTPKTVTLVADGRRQRVVTTAATVGQALDEAGVEVDGDDKVSQLATAAVVDGMTVTVTRVTRKTTTTRTVLEYDTVEKQDADAAVGSRKVTTEGVNGLQQVTYVETYVDGKLTSRKVAKVTVLKQPVDEVVVVGPEPPPTQPAECADFPTTGGLNWCGLAKCESGLNPDAYNPAGPYYGLYQFDVGTWQSNGGTGTPIGKSIAEQTRVAYNLYQARGASPWPTCGRYL